MTHARVFLVALAGAAAVLVLGHGAASRAPEERAAQTVSSEKHYVLEAERQGRRGAPQTSGADVTVTTISGQITSVEQNGVRAYAAGTTSCNIGTHPLQWHGESNRHPVIGQNMYRLAPRQNGHLRFEQLGQSWLKHGFCALDLNLGECGECSDNLGCAMLAVGCEDPYTAIRNFAQAPLGPKYQVNATTGAFPYPPANPPWNGALARRLQVPLADTLPDLNPGAQYLMEVQYIHPQDAPAANWTASLNNVSYRRMQLNVSAAFTGYVDTTVQRKPALHHWQAVDPEVTLSDVDIVHWGRITVGSRAYDNGDGTWDYEYAVYNMHFDRGIGTFSVPLPPGAQISAAGFRDVRYHSGEPFEYSGEDGVWRHAIAGEMISWTTPQTFQQNANANAIRWGTMYNFRFTADVPPQLGEAVLRAFNPYPLDMPQTFAAIAQVPALSGSRICPGDLNGNGTVDFVDLVTLLSAWGPCAACPEDLSDDGEVEFADLLKLLTAWGDCSPG